MNKFSIIVATATDNAIGLDGDMIWHIHDDMVFFKQTTRGHAVLMGRKTWESLQVRPLPGRKNIVISKTLKVDNKDVIVYKSLKEALEKMPDFENEVFVIGGGSVYKAMIPIVDKLYITKVYKQFDKADTYFPKTDPDQWETVSESGKKKDAETELIFEHIVYRRKKNR